MCERSKEEIVSLPQRNRRKVNACYLSEEEVSEGEEKSWEDSYVEKVNLPEKKKEYKYEYLDHTADVILHSYGNSLQESFISVGISMFNYMCNVNNVKLLMKRRVKAKGECTEDLLYNFLTELHFLYGNEYFICKDIDIVTFDMENFYIEAYGYGEHFSPSKHESGTEIKAITKHELKIISHSDDTWEIFVLVDI
ncbi:protein archease, putative [Plasmodium ovale]|uniref:Protein archease-like n=2 Tax=Plasmodium ovale TaxID=36330 RepID=A0A1A8X4K1_PLAOA|nr:protein archease, putative [Plasmodium ovale curtisi]SBS99104.1 protein archease, putative [Plasmodium ovale curtisi]SCP06140.1 protein archease, putative [Plasmodium ovale]